MINEERSSLRLIELLHLKHLMNDGYLSKDDFNRLVRLNDEEESPLSMFLLGKAYYLGLGTKLDKNEAMKYFEFVADRGNFEVITQMFMLLMDDENDKTKIMIINALQKAKKEFEDMMAFEDEDDLIDDYQLEELPRA